MKEIIKEKIDNKIIINRPKKTLINKSKTEATKLYDFLELTNSEVNDQEVKGIVRIAFKSIKKSEKLKVLSDLYSIVMKATNKDELKNMIDIMISNIEDKTSKSYATNINVESALTKIYQSKEDKTLNQLAYQVIKEYYSEIIKQLDGKIISKIAYIIISDDSEINEIMDYLKKDKNKFANEKVYNLSKEILKEEVAKSYYEKENHQCWSCRTKIIDCPKVLDREKKPIEKYKFITDGKQVVKENGEMSKFIVKRCLKFKA